MRRELGTASEPGRRSSETRANTGKARQLARWLGLDWVSKLTDEEACQFVEFMNYLGEEEFSAGWRAAQAYNRQTSQLYAAGPTMNH